MRITEPDEAVPMRITEPGEAVRITEPGEAMMREGDRGYSVSAHSGKGKGKGIGGLWSVLTVKIGKGEGITEGMEVSKFSRAQRTHDGLRQTDKTKTTPKKCPCFSLFSCRRIV
jgi:hypothetical protein